MASILIVDDDPEIRKILIQFFNDMDVMTMVAETLCDGLEMVSSGAFDLVLLDVNLPDGSGLESLSVIKNAPSKPEVIIITGEGSSQGAKMALHYGAWDYILKPFIRDEIKLAVERSLAYRRSKEAMKSLSENTLNRSNIIGSSPQIMSKLNMVAQCAKSDANVLITGPTGTGKELFANAIHINGRRPVYVIHNTVLAKQKIKKNES